MFKSSLCILGFVLICAATLVSQDLDEYGRETWPVTLGIYGEPVTQRNDLYSQADAANFRSRISLLIKRDDVDWQGSYYSDTDTIGFSRFYWNSRDGYAGFYLYTCTPEKRWLDYGSAIETSNAIVLSPIIEAGSPRKSKPKKYIKVKWDARKYLVAESSLLAFSEKAAGLDVSEQTEESPSEHSGPWSDYWVRGDLEKLLKGLPTFPKEYEAFRRTPISTRLISVSKPVVVEEYETGNGVYASPHNLYRVVLDAGKNKGVRKGMRFFTGNSADEIYVEKVEKNRSIAVILRYINDEARESCTNDRGSK
ncbi:MAG: hypothetical protein ABL999_12930 [Pyrinomonadaceae bacterium]